MKRRNVYMIMAGIILSTVAAFAFIFMNQSRALPSMSVLTDGGNQPSYSGILYGDFDNPLKKPMDVASSGQFIYISDPDSNQIKMLDNSGNVIYTYGERGNEPGQLQFPYGLSFDETTKQLYVADLYTGYISIFSDKLDYLGYFAEEYTEDYTIDSPAGLRIVDDKLYLTDVNINKIFVFSLDGELLLTFGEDGMEDGQLSAPNSIAVDRDKNIYVSDSGNDRVQVFTPQGEFIRSINGSPDGQGDPVFSNPRGIAIDANDRLFVVNNMVHRIHAFDLEGRTLYSFGSMGQGSTEFFLPNGLYIDKQNTLYITDTVNQRVLMYR